MLRWFCFYLALWLSPCWLHSQEVEAAKKYLGCSERANKQFSCYELEQNLCKQGWKPGLNWCAFFVSSILDETQNKVVKVRSGLARAFVLRNSIPAKRVLAGQKVQKDWLIIWQRGSTIFGHIGFVVAQEGRNRFRTIEGNTENAVRIKVRTIEPLNYFRVTHFTKTK